MGTFVAKRVGAMAVIIVALATVVFYLQHISPLDPVHALLGGQASAEAIAQQRHVLHLDRPFLSQLGHYLNGLLHGDLGHSYRTRRPVSTDLGDYVPATVELAFYGIVIALLLGGLMAFASTLRWKGAPLFRGVLLVGASAPTFLLGIGGIIIFYEKLGWLPANGRTSIDSAPSGPTGLLTVDAILHGRFDVWWNALEHLAMPATAIALGPAVAIGRVLRSSLTGELTSDYARTARAKGLSESAILRRHILRNAVGATLSMTGLQVGLLFAGVLVIEQVFSWPGVGQYVAQSIPVADFPAIAGVTLLLGVAYVFINTLVDLLQAVADPRIKV
ncbi:MAG TPA: ABC transporter permease [Mycobacteriales bacterium]|nr:ABC transporter permease [Mycobacteriales bacterium]